MNPIVEKIKEIAENEFALSQDSIHGVDHWNEVYKNGIMLSKQEGVDPLVVSLFSYLHDCKREDDFEDWEHGERASAFVIELQEKGMLPMLSSNQFSDLCTACYYHNKAVVEKDNPTIGACYDADRLELVRCGIIPDPSLMNTEVGIRIAEKMQEIETKPLENLLEFVNKTGGTDNDIMVRRWVYGYLESI